MGISLRKKQRKNLTVWVEQNLLFPSLFSTSWQVVMGWCVIDWWGGKKGKFVRELLQGVEAFCFLIYRKKIIIFQLFPKAEVILSVLRKQMTLPPDN